MLLLLIATILCRMASRHNIHIHFSIHFLTKIVICSCPFLYFFSSYRKSGWRGSGRAVLAGRRCWVLWVEATGGRWRREMMPDPEHQSSFQQPVSVDTHWDATHSASLPGHCSERIHTHFHFTLIFIFCTYTYKTQVRFPDMLYNYINPNQFIVILFWRCEISNVLELRSESEPRVILCGTKALQVKYYETKKCLKVP